MFPDIADPIVLLKDSQPASYQLSFSVIQKEQVGYLYQLNHKCPTSIWEGRVSAVHIWTHKQCTALMGMKVLVNLKGLKMLE